MRLHEWGLGLALIIPLIAFSAAKQQLSESAEGYQSAETAEVKHQALEDHPGFTGHKSESLVSERSTVSGRDQESESAIEKAKSGAC